MGVKAIAHYTQICKKCSYLPYTLQLFFTTAAIISTVLCMGNDFPNDFVLKKMAVLCVVCKALNTTFQLLITVFNWATRVFQYLSIVPLCSRIVRSDSTLYIAQSWELWLGSTHSAGAHIPLWKCKLRTILACFAIVSHVPKPGRHDP